MVLHHSSKGSEQNGELVLQPEQDEQFDVHSGKSSIKDTNPLISEESVHNDQKL